jgi:hypothetical protein
MFSEPAIERWMRAALGFGVEEADRLVTAIFEFILEPPREVRQDSSVDNLVGLGERLAFSPLDIASRANLDEEVAAAFCEMLATRFGQTPREWQALPTALRHRPLVSDGTGRYLAPVPAMLRRGLRHSLAAALNPDLPALGPGDKTSYQRYLARRASLLESRGLVPLQQLLAPDYAVSNLHFTVRGADGKHWEGELDGLVTIDRTAIVVQAKSAPTRIDVLAGSANKFADALRAIVKDSMRQHDDARAALLAPRDSVVFWLRQGGRTVKVDPPDLSGAEFLPITVTLDDLAGCAPFSWKLRDARLATDGAIPWIVGSTSLETMLDLLTFPAQLVQFLRRRSTLNESRNLAANDEMDVFLEYLQNRLEFVYAGPRLGTDRVLLLPPERFHALDDWLHAKDVGDSRVKRPRQKLHRGIRALLERLGRDRPTGWLNACVAVLDVPGVFHQRVGAIATQALSSTRGPEWNLVYPSLTGETRLLVLISESWDARRDDGVTLGRWRWIARVEACSMLTVIVVPEYRSAPLRVLCAEETVK